jgi:hypothetical protein
MQAQLLAVNAIPTGAPARACTPAEPFYTMPDVTQLMSHAT